LLSGEAIAAEPTDTALVYKSPLQSVMFGLDLEALVLGLGLAVP